MPPQLQPVPHAPIDAIGYIRVSTAREEMISPDIQRAAITDWARRTGRRIVAWIEDLDMSGRNFKRKIMKGIERIEAREAREIAVYRYDRWGRNGAESLANIRRVELAGGQVQSATEPFDPETAIGKYSRHNALGLAEMQSNIIGENWRATHSYRLDQGLPSASRRRFGYVLRGRVEDPLKPGRRRRDPTDPLGERYEPDPDLTEVYRGLYVRYVAGEGADTLIRRLNDAGVLNVWGRKWQQNTLIDTLDSGFAAGLLRIHNPECRCADVSACRDRIYIPGTQEPIIDEPELWEAYLKRREQVRHMPPRSRAPVYPLSGLVVCGHCHHAMVAHSGGGMVGATYQCSRWRMYQDCPLGTGGYPKRVDAEAAVLEALQGWAADLDDAAAKTRAREAAQITARADRDSVERELLRVDQALTRLTKARAMDPDMPDGVYEAAKSELLAERRTHEAALGRMTEAQTRSPESYRPILQGVLAEWDVLPVARKRDLLRQLIRHVAASRPDGPKTPPVFVVTPVWEDCPHRCCAVA